ncbi:MAG: hypothetical protein KIT24_12625 [Phycisphaeraceae bacterium]|nr:hypothetical protein [Phycisphaeraceae bacterium]
MATHSQQPDPTNLCVVIAPGWVPATPERPAAAPAGTPRRPSDETICEVHTALESQDHSPTEGERIGRRLFLALAGFILLGPGLLLLLGLVGIHVPGELALALLATIAFGAGFAAIHEPVDPERLERRKRRRQVEAEGRPVGCCSGPRPLRCFKE